MKFRSQRSAASTSSRMARRISTPSTSRPASTSALLLPPRLRSSPTVAPSSAVRSPGTPHNTSVVVLRAFRLTVLLFCAHPIQHHHLPSLHRLLDPTLDPPLFVRRSVSRRVLHPIWCSRRLGCRPDLPWGSRSSSFPSVLRRAFVPAWEHG